MHLHGLRFEEVGGLDGDDLVIVFMCFAYETFKLLPTIPFS